MSNASRAPGARQEAGPGASLAPIREAIADAKIALDDLRTVMEDALSDAPVMGPKAQILDMLRAGGLVRLHVLAAASVAAHLHYNPLHTLRASLASAEGKLSDLRRELEVPGAAIPADVRELEAGVRELLDVAGDEIAALGELLDRLDAQRARSHEPCRIVPRPPVGCPLRSCDEGAAHVA